MMTGRPLFVAGVAGGVGTSTWCRIVRVAVKLPVEDLGRYRGGPVDVLVTSNTAAATSRLGPALGLCPRAPVLVVMHTVPGAVVGARSHLRRVEPHIVARLDVAHHRSWLEMAAAPGERLLPRLKDVVEALQRLPAALSAMYDLRPPHLVSVPSGPSPDLGNVRQLSGRAVQLSVVRRAR